jgi:apolipoprotein N-acyltransferase
MRAIELRRDLVRAVNLGVSGWIDASGRVRARRDDPAPGWLLVSPKLRSGSATIYTRFGDAPAALLLLLGMLAARWRWRSLDEPLSANEESANEESANEESANEESNAVESDNVDE